MLEPTELEGFREFLQKKKVELEKSYPSEGQTYVEQRVSSPRYESIFVSMIEKLIGEYLCPYGEEQQLGSETALIELTAVEIACLHIFLVDRPTFEWAEAVNKKLERALQVLKLHLFKES